MKKCLAVVLMLCLLMSLAATAFAEKKVYQDEMAPELVPVSDGQGSEAVAQILDAEGNVIAVVPTSDLLKRIDIGERENEPDAGIAALLEKGLCALLEDAHYANGPWTVDTDLFHVEIPQEYSEHFADGSAQLKMTFAPTFSAPIVLTSADGESWSEAAGVGYESSGAVKVSIKESGLLAFLVDHGNAFGNAPMADTADGVGLVEDETNPNFTPSVSGKLAPEVVTFETEGERFIATILDSNEEVVASVPDQQWVVVTPLSERKYNPDVVTYEHLQWAYDVIRTAASIGDLPAEGQDGTLGEVIDLVLGAKETGLSHMDLTISDLFEISVYGDYLQHLKADAGNVLEITFDRGLEPDDTLVVLCSSGIDRWHVMDAENVVINADGTVTLRLQHVGVVAFLVEKAMPAVDADAADAVIAP